MAKQKTEKKKKPTKREKKTFLPGMEPLNIPELTEATNFYYDAMLARQKLSKEEKEAKDNLLAKMRAKKLEKYETPDGLVVNVLEKEVVSVKQKAEQTNGVMDI